MMEASLHPPATIDVNDDWSLPSNRSEISSPPNTPLSQKNEQLVLGGPFENHPGEGSRQSQTNYHSQLKFPVVLSEEEPGYIPKRTTVSSEEDPGYIPSPPAAVRKLPSLKPNITTSPNKIGVLTPQTVDLSEENPSLLIIEEEEDIPLSMNRRKQTSTADFDPSSPDFRSLTKTKDNSGFSSDREHPGLSDHCPTDEEHLRRQPRNNPQVRPEPDSSLPATSLPRMNSFSTYEGRSSEDDSEEPFRESSSSESDPPQPTEAGLSSTDSSPHEPQSRKQVNLPAKGPITSLLGISATSMIQSTYENIDKIMLQPIYNAEGTSVDSPPSMVRIPRISDNGPTESDLSSHVPTQTQKQTKQMDSDESNTFTRQQDGGKWWIEDELMRRVNIKTSVSDEKKEDEAKPNASLRKNTVTSIEHPIDDIDLPLRREFSSRSTANSYVEEDDIDRPMQSRASVRNAQRGTTNNMSNRTKIDTASDLPPLTLPRVESGKPSSVVLKAISFEDPTSVAPIASSETKSETETLAPGLEHLRHLLKVHDSEKNRSCRSLRDPSPSRSAENGVQPVARSAALVKSSINTIDARDPTPAKGTHVFVSTQKLGTLPPPIISKSDESINSQSLMTLSDNGSSAKADPTGISGDALVKIESLDIDLGVPLGDGVISLLVETNDMTWSNRVEEAIWRCRIVRQQNDTNWTTAKLEHKLRGKVIGRTSTVVDLDDGKILGGILSYEKSAHENLRYDDLDEALSLYEDIIRTYYDVFEHIQGRKDSSSQSQIKRLRVCIGTALHNLGVVHMLRGEYKEALNYFERAATNRKACSGTNTLDYLSSLAKTALCRMAVEDFEAAKKDFENILALAQSSLSGLSYHRLCAEALNNLGVIWHLSGKTEKAIKLFHEAIKTHIVVNESSLYTGTKFSGHTASLNQSVSKANVGYIALLSKRIPASIQSFEFSLREQQVLLRDAHSTLIATMDHLAVANLINGSKEKAECLLRRILGMQIEAYGPEHWRAKSTRDRLGALAKETDNKKGKRVANASKKSRNKNK